MTTYEYPEPDVDQAERRAVLRSSPEPTTYHALAQRPVDGVANDDASSKPYGHNLPLQSYGVDPTGAEPPLGVDVNELPDMEACLVPGAVSARALRAAAAQVDADSAALTNQTGVADADE